LQVVSRYDRRAVDEKLGEEEERVSVGKVSSFLLSIMCSLIRQVNAYEGGRGGKEKGYLRAFRSYFHPQQIVPITQQNECWKTASFSFSTSRHQVSECRSYGCHVPEFSILNLVVSGVQVTASKAL